MPEAEGTVTPAVTATPAVPAPVVAPPAQARADEASPAWLPERLARAAEAERAKVLQELGVDDASKAKAAIAAAKKAEDEAKTVAEKAAEAAAEAKSAKKQVERLSAITTEYAARMMVGLTEAQQAAVKKIAGDDPGAQLQAITVLAPTWAKDEAELAKIAAAAAPPANTAPPPTAPPATSPGAPPDHRTNYTALAEKNPFAAAAYGQANPAAYEIKQ